MDGNADGGRRTGSRHATGLSVAMAVGMGIALVAGSCDTTADISFPNRTFSNVRSSGFIAPKGQCGELGTGNNPTQAKLRFAMVAGNDTPIKPGEALAEGTVQLDSEGLSPSNSYVFERPDLQCGTDAVGGSDDRLYEFDGSCGNDYTCSVATQTNESDLKRCNASTTVSVQQGSVEFVSDDGSDKVFGALIENSRGVRGYRSDRVAQAQGYDFNGDGSIDADEPKSIQGFDDDLRTDPDNSRTVGLRPMADKWERVRNAIDDDGREAYFGLWEMNGEVQPPSVVDSVTSDKTIWTTDPATAGKAARRFPKNTQDNGDGNVIQAMYELLNGPFSADEVSDAEKTLVVFADGPPSTPIAANDAIGLQDVIDLANDNDVRIFIVQLDTKINYREIYDDPTYWQAQNQGCSSDSDCKNFETCRRPRGYDTNGNEMINLPANNDTDYCMPEYQIVNISESEDDEQWEPEARIGPVEDYGRLACATQGGFIYVKVATRDLVPSLRWLPYTIEGLWEADVTIDAFAGSAQKFTPGEANRLQSTVEVNPGRTSQTLDLSQIGGNHDNTQPDSGDRRSVLFMGTP